MSRHRPSPVSSEKRVGSKALVPSRVLERARREALRELGRGDSRLSDEGWRIKEKVVAVLKMLHPMD